MPGRPSYFVLGGTLQDGTSINGDVVDNGDNSNLQINLFNTAVPEPSSLALGSLAVSAVAGYGLRRRKTVRA